MQGPSYRLVQLANGVRSIRSLAHGETMHPCLGPSAEAEALYVRQLRLMERLERAAEEFVVWDVGLGGAANALAVLGATRGSSARLRLISFDEGPGLVEFALANASALGYFAEYQAPLRQLARQGHAQFQNGCQPVIWEAHFGDFPAVLETPQAPRWPKPHAILYDPFSPAKNPAMWTLPVLSGLHRLLDPVRPCLLATYSRSTMVRVTLLLAGFYVGAGQPTGPKQETTVAANHLALLEHPLAARWLDRARRSNGAEPLATPAYRQAALSAQTWSALRSHPQFQFDVANPNPFS